MSTAFGAQLIGETEKTLGALLRRCLAGSGLTEPQWVTLRLAGTHDGAGGGEGLAAELTRRARFTDSAELVAGLADRGLVDGGRLTAAGRDLVASLQTRITAETARIWDDLPADDVAATTRVLNQVVARARAALD